VNVELDKTDIVLLSELQIDAAQTQAELGKKIGLSTTAVNRRIRRLTQSGVIEKTTSALNQTLLGRPLTVIANVEVVSEQLDEIDKLESIFSARTEIQQCYYVTGEWDFVLVILVRDMAEYDHLTKELFFNSANVKRFKSLVVMRRTKVGLTVPLGPL
jgi:DNA-binding Lrp family transcriptional regulator